MTNASVTVVGGAYGEVCAYPPRQVYRGSGCRAAAIMASLGVRVTLDTVIGPSLAPQFDNIARECGYTLNAKLGSQDIWFRYRHPLGQPTIYPALVQKLPNPHIVEAKLALVFGMMEGRPIVRAERAVYDPQDGFRSEHFSANGSTASELAMVVSYSEGRALTNESDPELIADRLLGQANVTAVVVKCGPQGALAATRNKRSWVRSFPTKKVYKIGSGDAFSGAFAYAWLVENQDAVAAAWFASRVAAAYVESAQDRFTMEMGAKFAADATAASERFGGTGPRTVPETQIYLAGPFFSTAQQWLVDEVRGALTDMGFNVFSPSHQVGLGPAEEVAPADLFGLEQSGLVLALLDGFDPGTVFEVGYARSKGIPVIAIAELADENSLTMVLGSGCEVANDLSTGIYAACWHLMGDV